MEALLKPTGLVMFGHFGRDEKRRNAARRDHSAAWFGMIAL
jgi:hypothetical protein